MSFFEKKNPSLTNFSTSSLHTCEQRGASNCKILKKLKFLRRQNFYEFSEKVTTDFENRAKRQAETKA